MAGIVSYEEMEAKRQEMIASFKDIAAAMTRCVAIIEDYARLTPSTLTTSAALAAVENGAHAVEALAAAAAGKKVRAKKEKKIKDPNAPKRPPSAYLLFQNDVREQIRQENPGLPYKEVLSVIAQRWKALSESQRKVYENAYTEATTEFREAEQRYKTGQIVGIIAEEDETESSSEEESDDGTPTKTAAAVATLATPTPGKKDKKRKNAEELVAAVEPSTDKKKKNKKSKD